MYNLCTEVQKFYMYYYDKSNLKIIAIQKYFQCIYQQIYNIIQHRFRFCIFIGIGQYLRIIQSFCNQVNICMSCLLNNISNVKYNKTKVSVREKNMLPFLYKFQKKLYILLKYINTFIYLPNQDFFCAQIKLHFELKQFRSLYFIFVETLFFPQNISPLIYSFKQHCFCDQIKVTWNRKYSFVVFFEGIIVLVGRQQVKMK
eukprot:TRINITY_DN12298_c0_g1_i1.p1 TRINITY_DN12298_c0_g1~~TRINITY_DN12298_c0_g1_i1.p1  ORF type:complete len:201 (-),score=-24.76 TRINITY_DN12298_c0_g1_i1:328-930(-)